MKEPKPDLYVKDIDGNYHRYEQEQGEPVAWMYPDARCDRNCLYLCTKGFTQFPECATTLQQRKPLTDEQIGDIAALYYPRWQGNEGFARAIEAAHGIHPSDFKEKNTWMS